MNSLPEKICFYIIVTDSGLAPNPFYGSCTLALCTPNHMRARLKEDDWIVGCFRSGQPPRVVYVMQVDEVMLLDRYYRDPRFICKKPSGNDWKTQVGDNMYYLDSNGLLQQDPNTSLHKEQETQEKDKRGNKVFIGKQFVYLGRKATPLPPAFHKCLPPRQGIKYLRSNDPFYQEFLTWSYTLGNGYKGDPRDRKTSIVDNCAGGCR